MKILAVSFEVRAGISFEQGTLDLLPALTVYHPARDGERDKGILIEFCFLYFYFSVDIIGGQNERQ